MRMQRAHPRWNHHVKLVEIHIVAAPRERLAVSGEHQARNAIRGTGRPMIAGNPFGSDNGERPLGHWQIHFGVKELAWSVRKVGGDLNRWFLTLSRGGRGEEDGENCYSEKC